MTGPASREPRAGTTGDAALDAFIARAREPVRVDPAAVERVAGTLRAESEAGWQRRWRARLFGRRVSPVLAAALVVMAFLAGRAVPHREAEGESGGEAASRDVTFVLVMREARRVSLVGDFNDWDAGRTRMRVGPGGVWSVVVPLDPGRYNYAFIVDGEQWVADPAAPPATGEDFGRPSSVVMVERERT